jgi:hypothetical protein
MGTNRTQFVIAEMEAPGTIPYVLDQSCQGSPEEAGLGGFFAQEVQDQTQSRFATYAGEFGERIHRILDQLGTQIHAPKLRPAATAPNEP